VLAALVREGADIEAINGERLLREMAARCGDDPWALDLNHLAARLASGEFRVTDIRTLPCRDSSWSCLPAHGSRSRRSGSRFKRAPGEPLRLTALSLGRHLLFPLGLPGGFSLYVRERDALLVPLLP